MRVFHIEYAQTNTDTHTVYSLIFGSDSDEGVCRHMCWCTLCRNVVEAAANYVASSINVGPVVVIDGLLIVGAS